LGEKGEGEEKRSPVTTATLLEKRKNLVPSCRKHLIFNNHREKKEGKSNAQEGGGEAGREMGNTSRLSEGKPNGHSISKKRSREKGEM